MERRLLLVARASLVDDMVGEEMETRMDDGEILLRQDANLHVDAKICSAAPLRVFYLRLRTYTKVPVTMVLVL